MHSLGVFLGIRTLYLLPALSMPIFGPSTPGEPLGGVGRGCEFSRLTLSYY